MSDNIPELGTLSLKKNPCSGTLNLSENIPALGTLSLKGKCLCTEDFEFEGNYPYSGDFEFE